VKFEERIKQRYWEVRLAEEEIKTLGDLDFSERFWSIENVECQEECRFFWRWIRIHLQIMSQLIHCLAKNIIMRLVLIMFIVKTNVRRTFHDLWWVEDLLLLDLANYFSICSTFSSDSTRLIPWRKSLLWNFSQNSKRYRKDKSFNKALRLISSIQSDYILSVIILILKFG